MRAVVPPTPGTPEVLHVEDVPDSRPGVLGIQANGVAARYAGSFG